VNESNIQSPKSKVRRDARLGEASRRLVSIAPYFNSIERILQLETIAESWKGTPFMPNAAIKGAGVSCQKLIGQIYIEIGFLPADFKIPEGPMDWSNAHKDSLIAAFMDTLPNFIEVGRDARLGEASRRPVPIAPGDMIGIKLGGCIQHCGVVLNTNGKFIHCLRDRVGVQFNNIRDANYMKRIEKVWRPIL
jgi:cell wall-associated NlpC family hydrolase